MTDGQIWDPAYNDEGFRIVFRPQDRFTKKQRERIEEEKAKARSNEETAHRIAETRYQEDAWDAEEGGGFSPDFC